MEKHELEFKRRNGVFYTPKVLAEFLVKSSIEGSSVSVLDPSYGDGALLLAVEKIFKTKRKADNCEIQLFGCDTNPVNGLLKHLPSANLTQKDFFKFNPERKFDLIVTNPPYIKHQNREKIEINLFDKLSSGYQILENVSDTWAFFIVKLTSHLKKKGNVAAILPWAFLEANYSVKLRAWLAENFSTIRVLGLSDPYFDKAQERVIILWLEGFEEKLKQIEYGSVKNIDCEIVYSNLTLDSWLSPRVLRDGHDLLANIVTKLEEEYNFIKLKSCADIRIGIVTGANRFFIRSTQDALNLGFCENEQTPILTGASDLVEYLKTGSGKLKLMLNLNESNKDYLKIGLETKVHERSHSKLRSPWFKVKEGKLPDAFFPYRVGKLPFLVLSKKNVQSTNAIHRIYFRQSSKTEQKWVSVSMMSIYGQIVIHKNAKTYGRSMIKIEPTALSNSLVFKSKDRSIDSVYNKMVKLIGLNEREKAVNLATAFIDRKLKIDLSLRKNAKIIWELMNK